MGRLRPPGGQYRQLDAPVTAPDFMHAQTPALARGFKQERGVSLRGDPLQTVAFDQGLGDVGVGPGLGAVVQHVSVEVPFLLWEGFPIQIAVKDQTHPGNLGGRGKEIPDGLADFHRTPVILLSHGAVDAVPAGRRRPKGRPRASEGSDS